MELQAALLAPLRHTGTQHAPQAEYAHDKNNPRRTEENDEEQSILGGFGSAAVNKV